MFDNPYSKRVNDLSRAATTSTISDEMDLRRKCFSGYNRSRGSTSFGDSEKTTTTSKFDFHQKIDDFFNDSLRHLNPDRFPNNFLGKIANYLEKNLDMAIVAATTGAASIISFLICKQELAISFNLLAAAAAGSMGMLGALITPMIYDDTLSKHGIHAYKYYPDTTKFQYMVRSIATILLAIPYTIVGLGVVLFTNTLGALSKLEKN